MSQGGPWMLTRSMQTNVRSNVGGTLRSAAMACLPRRAFSDSTSPRLDA